MAKRIEQTRFKLVIIGLALGLFEGLLRSFLKEFPIIEVCGFQGAVIGGTLPPRQQTTSNA